MTLRIDNCSRLLPLHLSLCSLLSLLQLCPSSSRFEKPDLRGNNAGAQTITSLALNISPASRCLAAIMIDPVVLSVNILAILHTNARTVQSVTHLSRKYLNAPAKLTGIRSESERIAITLLLLQSAIHKRAAVATALEAQWQLQSSLDNVLLSCLAAFKLLDRDLLHLLVAPEENVEWSRRSYVALDEDIMEYYLARLRCSMHALNLLLSCLQL